MNSNSRKVRIAKELLLCENFLTSEHLARLTNVTSRTIREDIKHLNSDCAQYGFQIKSTPGKGFWVDKYEKQSLLTMISFLMQKHNIVPVMPKNRAIYVIKRLLFQEDYTALESIANELFISKSTIEKDLVKVDEYLQQYNLALARKPAYGSKIVGKEFDKRRAMVECFLKSDSMWGDLEAWSGQAIVDGVKAILRDSDKQHRLNISSNDYNRLTIYLIISIIRIRKKHGMVSKGTKHSDSVAMEIAREMAQAIDKQFNIDMSKAEIICIKELFMQCEVFEIKHDMVNGNLQSLSLERLITEKANDINQIYASKILNSEAIDSLIICFQSLLYGHKPRREPGDVKRLKEEYPRAIEMAAMLSAVISDKMNHAFDDDENINIAYICATAIEKQKLDKAKAKKNVAIVCSSGIGGAQLLAVKIKRLYPDINIIGIYPAYRLHEARSQHPDFILSTIPIDSQDIPVVTTSPLIDDRDRMRIDQVMESLGADPCESTLFSSLFEADLFIAPMEAANKEEAIHILSQRMCGADYVDEEYEQRVLERERISSTAIGNYLAIPHGISRRVKKNCICVGILSKPMMWSDEKVQIIFLLSIQNTTDKNFTMLYERFFEIINSKHKMKRLIKATDFETFMAEIERR